LFRSSRTPAQVCEKKASFFFCVEYNTNTPSQLDKTEIDCRNKMDNADAQYKIQQKKTIQTHAEYYEVHLPKVLKVWVHRISGM
jgi:hypothetical protein